MTDQAGLNNTFTAAVDMYRRLRLSGQSQPLARISVEARYSKLTSLQRQLLRQLIAHAEPSVNSPYAGS